MVTPSTKHASFGGGKGRRMFTSTLQMRHRDEDLQLLRDDLAGNARFWHERAYGDVMIETASPPRMVHLEQRLANDDHLPELVRKAREEMDEPSRGYGGGPLWLVRCSAALATRRADHTRD